MLPRRTAAFVMAATAATGVGIAAYQTWLQRFAKGASCTADQPWWEHFVNWAGAQWPLMFEASGLCSEAGWKFLGLSIAEWSLFAFTCMTLAMLMAMLGKATPPLNTRPPCWSGMPRATPGRVRRNISGSPAASHRAVAAPPAIPRRSP
jgi:hypothetical protein